jgi:hypothetical protein
MVFASKNLAEEQFAQVVPALLLIDQEKHVLLFQYRCQIALAW